MFLQVGCEKGLCGGCVGNFGTDASSGMCFQCERRWIFNSFSKWGGWGVWFPSLPNIKESVCISFVFWKGPGGQSCSSMAPFPKIKENAHHSITQTMECMEFHTPSMIQEPPPHHSSTQTRKCMELLALLMILEPWAPHHSIIQTRKCMEFVHFQ